LAQVPGSGLGNSWSEEARKRHGNRQRGKKLSPEVRENMRKAKSTPEYKEKASRSHKGIRISDETKAKMSATRTGVKRGPMSEAQKVKLSESKKGHATSIHKGDKRGPMSDVQKIKISESHRVRLIGNWFDSF
jgi:hypothetical protein